MGTGTERNEARWRGAVVTPEQTAAHQRTISLQSVERRTREQASAPDRAGQHIVAEAIDHVPDNAIAGDTIDIAANGVDQRAGVIAGAVEHIADAAATGNGVNGLARGRYDGIDQVGRGIPEI